MKVIVCPLCEFTVRDKDDAFHYKPREGYVEYSRENECSNRDAARVDREHIIAHRSCPRNPPLEGD